MTKITLTELRLFLRDPATSLIVLALPAALVALFGVITHPAKGGDPIETYFPAMALSLGLAQLALNLMPTTLAGYREKGILRRMSTTPVHPRRLLGAQLAVSALLSVTALVLVVLVATIVFGFDPPRHPAGFAAAFLLGTPALLAVGLFVAAVAPSARAATGIGVGLFFVSLAFGGVFMPAETLPGFLVAIGDYTPLGAFMQALRAGWSGTWPQALHLAVLAGVTAVFGALAVRMFRWE
ncbi:ABC transporter permease [Streptosporangium sp. NPDC000396]|uniref:ABC transporter permease n=1 Tax=Streptosporangium sp. NPDC000396 TaxID=3366185 RepID=UPI003677814F